MSAEVIAGFTEVQAERLTGVSQRQLRYWARSSFFMPSLKVEDAELSDMRLYSFRDLACLKVISALRNEAKVPLQELRRVKSRLVRLGEDLWATTTLYVLGKRVVFDNPETGGKEEVATGQGVFQIPLKVVTGEIEEAIRQPRARRRRETASRNTSSPAPRLTASVARTCRKKRAPGRPANRPWRWRV